MTTSDANDQFSKIAQQGQDAVNAAVKSWTDAVERLSAPTAVGDVPDLSAVVDQTFDFAAKLLSAQRDLTKTVLETVANASQEMTSSATAAAQNLKPQG